MLIIKGIYEDNEIKLMEHLNIKGKHLVEIRFLETDVVKNQVIEAFRKARGIWKDQPEIDDNSKNSRTEVLNLDQL